MSTKRIQSEGLGAVNDRRLIPGIVHLPVQIEEPCRVLHLESEDDRVQALTQRRQKTWLERAIAVAMPIVSMWTGMLGAHVMSDGLGSLVPEYACVLVFGGAGAAATLFYQLAVLERRQDKAFLSQPHRVALLQKAEQCRKDARLRWCRLLNKAAQKLNSEWATVPRLADSDRALGADQYADFVTATTPFVDRHRVLVEAIAAQETMLEHFPLGAVGEHFELILNVPADAIGLTGTYLAPLINQQGRMWLYKDLYEHAEEKIARLRELFPELREDEPKTK